MGAIRAMTVANRHAAFLLLLVALLVRVVVPSGYMFVPRDGFPTVEMCDGMVSANIPEVSMMPMHHPGAPQDAPREKTTSSGTPCAFAGVGAAFDLADDQILPVAAAPFVVPTLLFGKPATQEVRVSFPHVRPLLRGPPALR